VAEAVVAMSKGSAHTPEYFYVRLPCGEHPDSRQTRRFLYIHNPATKFKMHFGSEVGSSFVDLTFVHRIVLLCKQSNRCILLYSILISTYL
jgi:hypothetical protein